MKIIFPNKLDFTSFKIFFAAAAISLFGTVSDVSAAIENADTFRPDTEILKDERKICSVPFLADHCWIESQRANYCQAPSGSFLRSLNLNPVPELSVRPYCPTQGTSDVRKTET